MRAVPNFANLHQKWESKLNNSRSEKIMNHASNENNKENGICDRYTKQHPSSLKQQQHPSKLKRPPPQTHKQEDIDRLHESWANLKNLKDIKKTVASVKPSNHRKEVVLPNPKRDVGKKQTVPPPKKYLPPKKAVIPVESVSKPVSTLPSQRRLTIHNPPRRILPSRPVLQPMHANSRAKNLNISRKLVPSAKTSYTDEFDNSALGDILNSDYVEDLDQNEYRRQTNLLQPGRKSLMGPARRMTTTNKVI